MAVATTTDFANLLEPAIRQIFHDEFDTPNRADIEVRSEDYGNYHRVSLSFRHNNKTYAKGVQIDRRAIRDNQWDLITRQLRGLVEACGRTMINKEIPDIEVPDASELVEALKKRAVPAFMPDDTIADRAVNEQIRKLGLC